MDLAGWPAVLAAFVSLLGSVAVLYKAHDERLKIRSEREKIEAEREQIEACASEKITQTALSLLRPLEARVTALEAENEALRAAVAVLRSENEELCEGVRLLSRQVEEMGARPAYKFRKR